MSSLVLVEYPLPLVAHVKINRPDKLNALSAELVAELQKTFVELGAKARSYQLRCVLLGSSEGKAFCAGADLVERKGMNETQVSQALLALRGLMDAVADMSCPTVAIVQGIAFGGGLELALSCDLRVAADDSRMGLTEVKLGIIPGAGGTQRLTKIVGEAKAKELILLAKILTGAQAKGYGMVHEVTSDPVQWALNQAETLADMAPIALASAKLAIEVGANFSMKDALDWERRCYENTLRSSDRVEGLNAFTEKRKAKYLGR